MPFDPMRQLASAGSAVTDAVKSVPGAISAGIDGIGNSISGWLGSGPSTSDAATAKGGDGLHQDAAQSTWGSIGQNIGDLGRGFQQEGLGGVLSGGALDRQQAQRDLSDRFQVVGAGQSKASNQVTQEEYQNIARTFSNIRRGKGDLSIDSSPFSPGPGTGDAEPGWNRDVQADIADIMMTPSGRRQIDNLSNNVAKNDDGTARENVLGNEIHHKTTIQPLMSVNGVGRPDPSEPGKMKYDMPMPWDRGPNQLVRDDARAMSSEDKFRSATGQRGAGDDSTIQYNPGKVAGLRSDVALMHEMEHALSQTQGTTAPNTFRTGTDAKVNNSERQAVGLTRSDSKGYLGDPKGCTENTYRQERNALGDQFEPRTSYSGPIPNMAPAGTTPAQLQSMWSTHNTGPNVPH